MENSSTQIIDRFAGDYSEFFKGEAFLFFSKALISEDPSLPKYPNRKRMVDIAKEYCDFDALQQKEVLMRVSTRIQDELSASSGSDESEENKVDWGKVEDDALKSINSSIL